MFLNLSLFLAVATLAPNLEILFLLVIPLKLKWVALISLLWPAYILVTGSLPVKMIVIMCLGNYLIFFGPSFLRRSRENRQTRQRRAKFEAAKDDSPTLHRCEACGITEASNPHADFRVATRRKRILHEAFAGPKARKILQARRRSIRDTIERSARRL